MNMNRTSLASAIAVISMLSAAQAHAQEAGASVATPPPTPTPTGLAPMVTLDPPSGSATTVGGATEPVIEPSTERRTLPNRPLLVTGLSVFAASYGAAVLVSALSDRRADDKLYIPVAGPWLDLKHRGCADNPCENNTRDRVLLVGDGILQGIGALAVVLSVVVPQKTTRRWYLTGNSDVLVVPQLSARMTGLSAVGRF